MSLFRWPSIILTGLILAGCSSFSFTNPQSLAQVSLQPELLESHNLNLQLTDGEFMRQLTNDDFQKRENETTGALASEIFETATAGNLSIEIRLSDAQTSELLASGYLVLELKEDWFYSIFLQADSIDIDPTEGCFGCTGYREFTIDQTAIDSTSSLKDKSLYAVWNGRSTEEKIVY